MVGAPPHYVAQFRLRQSRLNTMPRAAPGQASLFEWTPPPATARFDEERIRAATIGGRICRAVCAALRDSELSREDVAARMTCFLGERVSKAMLDAYASQAREDHMISVPRFVALLHVTRDRRLLEMVAEQFGWAVIERRYLPLIDLAAVQEQRDELTRRADALRRQARAGGAL